MRFNLLTGTVTNHAGVRINQGTQRWRLLIALLSAKGNIVLSERIADDLWPNVNSTPDDYKETVRVCVTALRRFVEGDGCRIENWWGVGYRLLHDDD